MYTRSYQIKKEPPKASCEEAELPLIEERAEQPEECGEPAEDAVSSNPQMKKRRYRAVRVPVLKECMDECDEPCDPECDPECCEDQRQECAPEPPTCKAHERGGLLRGFTSDELFILALIILLVCEGGDDILILALCFIVL